MNVWTLAPGTSPHLYYGNTSLFEVLPEFDREKEVGLKPEHSKKAAWHMRFGRV
jgi:hypothetical protein